jgi:type II secretory pathway predicted ATPase ExeA
MSSFFQSIGLSGENAFNLRFGDFFTSEQATYVLRRLAPLLELGGIGVLVGEPGVGKSRLLEYLIGERVDPNQYRALRIDFTNLSSGGFLGQLVYAFGEKPRRSKSDVVHQLTELWSCLSQKVFLVVDESDHLGTEPLDDLRLLTNRVGQARGMAVLLAGQPALRDLLRSPLQQALSQRVLCRATLRGWTLAETQSWLSKRLKLMEAPPHFMEVEAMEALFQHAKGNPRIINQTMTHCLIWMVTEGHRRLDADGFKRALATMEG